MDLGEIGWLNNVRIFFLRLPWSTWHHTVTHNDHQLKTKKLEGKIGSGRHKESEATYSCTSPADPYLISLPSYNGTIYNVTLCLDKDRKTIPLPCPPPSTCGMRGFELRCASSSIKTHIPLSLLCHPIKGTWASSSPFTPKCSTFLSLDMNILCWTQAAFYLNCVFKQKLHCYGLVSNFLNQPNLE